MSTTLERKTGKQVLDETIKEMPFYDSHMQTSSGDQLDWKKIAKRLASQLAKTDFTLDMYREFVSCNCCKGCYKEYRKHFKGKRT